MKNHNNNNSIRNLVVMFPFIVLGIIVLIRFSQEKLSESYSAETKIMMDTLVSVKVYGDKKIRNEGLRRAFDSMQRVENIASFHKKDSDLNILNKAGKIDNSSELAPILEKAIESHKLTESYFDPTFALIQKAYGFYDNKPRLPDQDELELLLARSGLTKQLTKTNTSWNLASGSMIDLGGIAGGFAIEEAIKALKNASCSAFFIDDAGDLWMEGKKPDSKPWRVAVRDPRDNSYLAIIESYEPVAISTSGDYERFITIDNKRYGHIMDPKTGIPADHYKSVTVIASSPILADTFSTAAFAMPLTKALDWTEKNNIPTLILTASGQVILNKLGKHWFKNVKNG
jgi:thiamine biosynthesis lipoprotein